MCPLCVGLHVSNPSFVREVYKRILKQTRALKHEEMTERRSIVC